MNRRLSAALIVAGSVAVVALLSGCSGSSAATAPSASPTAPASTVAATPPTVKVAAPLEGAEVPAGDVAVKVETTGLKFVMPSNTTVPGEGHVHFTLDDKPFEMSVKPEYVFKDVAPGPHTLKAELVQNDTTPFEPAVVQTVTFEVK